MSKFWKFLFFLSPLFVLLSLVSCLVPESTHVKPDYFLLSVINEDSNKTTKQQNNSFYLREIELPKYLRDSRMICRPTPESIEFRESKRWGEPLEDGIARVLSQNLAHELSATHFSIFPNRRKEHLVWDMSVSFTRFEITESGKFIMIASWVLRDESSKKITGSISDSFDFNFDGNVIEEVKAHSLALKNLASRIAEDL